MWAAIHTSSCLLKHSSQLLSAPGPILSIADINNSHIMTYQTKHIQISLGFFNLLFCNLRSQIFKFVSTGMKANNSLPSFNENFDFHTLLPPPGKTTTNNIAMRFIINEEGHTADYTSWCPSLLELNPTNYARPGLCCLQEKTFLLLTSFAATVTSAAANIICIKGWSFSNPAESSKNFHWWILQVCSTLLIHGSLYLL